MHGRQDHHHTGPSPNAARFGVGVEASDGRDAVGRVHLFPTHRTRTTLANATR